MVLQPTKVTTPRGKNVSKPSSLGKIEITTDLDVETDDDSPDLTEHYVEKPRRSSRIKQKPDIIRTIRTRGKRVKTSQSLSSLGTSDINMGGSCSKQLEECNGKVKSLEEKIKLYESWITAHEMKSSQTNLGLVNFGIENSNNGDCECTSSIWGILEILATIVVVIIFL